MVIDMFAVTCLSSVLLIFACFLLFLACRDHTQRILASVSGDAWQHPTLACLKKKIEMMTDPTYFWAARLVSIERKADTVEQADSEQTMAELLDEVAHHCQLVFKSQITLSNLELYAKSIYRLQHELALTDEDMSDILAATVTRIKGVTLLGKAVDQVELVKIGDRVDEKIMWPLNYGLKVKQPFGLVLKTESGDVLSKAKVTCV